MTDDWDPYAGPKQMLCLKARKNWYEDLPPRCHQLMGHKGPHKATKHWGVDREEVWEDDDATD